MFSALRLDKISPQFKSNQRKSINETRGSIPLNRYNKTQSFQNNQNNIRFYNRSANITHSPIKKKKKQHLKTNIFCSAKIKGEKTK